MTKVLILDLGTTYFKVALFDSQGKIAALSRCRLPVEHPQPDRWELDPDRFEQLLDQLLAEVAAQSELGLADVSAVSFATQANSIMLLDQAHRPLTPFILWPDERALDFSDDMRQMASDLPLQATTGVPALSHQFLPAKLQWFRVHRPDIWSDCRLLCHLSDYLTLYMTGWHATEAAVAGLSGLVDIHNLRWWPEACDRFELPPSWLPSVVRAGTEIGPLRSTVAKKYGLPSRCQFVIGCLDQFAGAIGAGNVTPGDVSETTGTVLATVRCTDSFEQGACSGVFQGPGFDKNITYKMVFGDVSANLLEAYRSSLPDHPDFPTLDREASVIAPGAEGLRLRRDADPSNPSTFFVGENAKHDRGHSARAVMEGVAFALSDQVGLLYGKEPPSVIRSVGGAARSQVWRQIKADVLNCPIIATSCAEPTSLGAALLAAANTQGIGLGQLSSQWIESLPPNLPNVQSHRLYGELRRTFHDSV